MWDVDLLLTDVMMPGLTGPALVKRVREHGLSVPVLFMSGYPEESLESVSGFNLDTDFLAKPFSSARLARCIAQKLGTAVAAVSDD